MKNKLKIVLVIAVVVFLFDHITKGMIVQYVSFGDSVAIIPNIFDIVHGRNTGAAFGFLSDWHSPYKDWFFYGVGIVALIFLYFYLKSIKATDRITLFSLALILGGACGNIFDRFFRGSVVDFLSFHYYHRICSFDVLGYHITFPLTWPAFNVADMAISTAVVLLLIEQFRQVRKEKKENKIESCEE